MSDSAESRVVFGISCFAEYRPVNPEDGFSQPWCVKKYADEWSFSLDRESDAMELMKRLDGLAQRQSVGWRG